MKSVPRTHFIDSKFVSYFYDRIACRLRRNDSMSNIVRNRLKNNHGRYIYIGHFAKGKPILYHKDLGLFSYVQAEEQILLTPYQFKVLLTHAPTFKKELMKDNVVLLRDLIKVYSELKSEEVADKEILFKKERPVPEHLVPYVKARNELKNEFKERWAKTVDEIRSGQH